ncbi:MAG: hypothetical protein IT271_11960 [Chitinophagales bacterium]|nr:hypothetical protein [Chitinophagales bacterium]
MNYKLLNKIAYSSLTRKGTHFVVKLRRKKTIWLSSIDKLTIQLQLSDLNVKRIQIMKVQKLTLKYS